MKYKYEGYEPHGRKLILRHEDGLSWHIGFGTEFNDLKFFTLSEIKEIITLLKKKFNSTKSQVWKLELIDRCEEYYKIFKKRYSPKDRRK